MRQPTDIQRMNNKNDEKLLREIFNEVDPIGLIDFDIPESLNEYNPEIREILQEDISKLDKQQLGQKIYAVFVKFFNAELAGSKDVYISIAEKILSRKK